MNSENKKKSQVTVHGSRNIFIGGNVSGSNIVTGDNNRINVENRAVIRQSEIDNAIQNKKRLIHSIGQSLSLSEITKLSFELGIDYDRIEAKSKSKEEIIFLLIDWIETQGKFSEFLRFLKAARPDVFDVITKLS